MIWFEGKMQAVHRVVYAQLRGEIPAGTDILHSCDAPNCCAIEHLRIGTKKENQADCIERGRLGKRQRLTFEDVVSIRASTAHDDVLANQFGVGVRYIRKLRSNEARINT